MQIIMKYFVITAITLVAIFFSTQKSIAQGIHAPGAGMSNPSLKMQNQGSGLGLQNNSISIYQQSDTPIMERDRAMDQDRTRLTLQQLLQTQQNISGIDPQLEALANQLNTSMQSTINAENKIRARNFFVSFFFGGDKTTAQQMLQTVSQNQQRIRQMQQIVDDCQCNEQLKTRLYTQLQTMTADQVRLMQMAKEELNRRGIFS